MPLPSVLRGSLHGGVCPQLLGLFKFVLPLFLHVLFLSVFSYSSLLSPATTSHATTCLASSLPPSSLFSPSNDNPSINKRAEKSFLTSESGLGFLPHFSGVCVCVCVVQYFSVYVRRVCNRSSALVYVTARLRRNGSATASVCFCRHTIYEQSGGHTRLGFPVTLSDSCVCGRADIGLTHAALGDAPHVTGISVMRRAACIAPSQNAGEGMSTKRNNNRCGCRRSTFVKPLPPTPEEKRQEGIRHHTFFRLLFL